MTTLDYGILIAYLALMVGMGLWFSRGQQDREEYLLAGRNIHWFLIIAASSVAPAFSGISLVGAPGYVFANDSNCSSASSSEC